MKITNLKILLLLISLGFTYNISNAKEYKKEIEEEFTCNNSTTLNINNKFGNIHIKNWDKSSIAIKVILSLDTYSEDKANTLFENFEIKTYETKNSVNARTQISPKFKTAKKFRIDYEITMPEYIAVNLTNKFGDILINTLKASANITLSYGNLIGGDFLYSEFTESSIQLSYAKANIAQCNGTKLKMKYSKVDITKCTDLVVESENSKLNISENNTVVLISSKNDAVNIQNIHLLKVDKGQSSYFNIENIYHKLDMNLQYGTFNISNVHQTFSAINIKNEHATGKIIMAENSAYTLNAQMQHCNIHYTEKTHIIENTTQDFASVLKATVGNPEAGKGTINLQSKYGDISVF